MANYNLFQSRSEFETELHERFGLLVKMPLLKPDRYRTLVICEIPLSTLFCFCFYEYSFFTVSWHDYVVKLNFVVYYFLWYKLTNVFWVAFSFWCFPYCPKFMLTLETNFIVIFEMHLRPYHGSYLLRSMFIISSDPIRFVNGIVNSWFVQWFCMDNVIRVCLQGSFAWFN